MKGFGSGDLQCRFLGNTSPAPQIELITSKIHKSGAATGASSAEALAAQRRQIELLKLVLKRCNVEQRRSVRASALTQVARAGTYRAARGGGGRVRSERARGAEWRAHAPPPHHLAPSRPLHRPPPPSTALHRRLKTRTEMTLINYSIKNISSKQSFLPDFCTTRRLSIRIFFFIFVTSEFCSGLN